MLYRALTFKRQLNQHSSYKENKVLDSFDATNSCMIDFDAQMLDFLLM